MSIRFGVRIPPCDRIDIVTRVVKQAEDAAFDTAWVPDSQLLWRDTWATMALAALGTERIELGTCVTTFHTRHWTVTADAAATVEELAPHRTILGLGTGDSSVKTIGQSPTRLGEMRRQIDLTRRLVKGETIEFEERATRLKIAPGHPIPVYMAATGPKSLELAGEIADGVILLTGLAPKLLERAFEHIDDGARRAGRTLNDVEICVGTFCHIAPDARVGARISKPYCVTLAQLGAKEQLQLAGIDIEVPDVIEGVYPDMSHAEDWENAIEVASRWVSDEMAMRYNETFCLVGNVDQCIQKLRAAIDIGVKSFYIRHFSSYILPADMIQVFGESIIPHFNGQKG